MEAENKGIGKGFKIAIAAVVLVGLATGGYFIYKYTRPAKPQLPEPDKGGSDKGGTGGSTDSGSEGGSTGGGGNSDSSFPISKGSRGKNVANFQAALNKFYKTAKDFTPLDTDGIFGSKTEAAMKRAYGKNKNEAVQGDIDWLNSHTFKPKK